MKHLYTSLASWWPLLSAPEDYREEAEFYRQLIASSCHGPVRTVLELGSGGGNNAAHLKKHFALTLLDLSAEMLNVSRELNPECEHIQGDMRSARLGQVFDGVFVHDAVMYATTEADLRATFETAFIHCRPGGAALFFPDYVRERFQPGASHGGHDQGARGLRYLEWRTDPDPNDTQYSVDYAFLLRDGDDVRIEYDRHVLGLFSRNQWLRWLADAGFEATSFVDAWEREAFIARRPESAAGR
jgi:SAM-dependent methyltransferase